MRNISEYSTFIFDWDGTISKLNLLYKMNRIFNPYWLYRKSISFNDPISANKSEIRKMLHKVHVREKETLKEEETFVMDKVLDIIHIIAKPRLNYGARTVLEMLQKEGKTIALLTDGKMDRVIREIKILKVYDYFDALLSAQTVGRLKPNPTGINVLLKILDVKKEDSMMIGDTQDDIMAAKNGGMASCGISAGLADIHTLKRYNPDYLFENMEQFKRSFIRTR